VLNNRSDVIMPWGDEIIDAGLWADKSPFAGIGG
jgi:hypothetical protein